MSYFAFGRAELKTEATEHGLRSGVRLAIERCAASAELAVALEGEREPLILAEMRGDAATAAEIPSVCLARRENDTSDALISPHHVGVEGACHAMSVIADWVRCVLRIREVERVFLWLTEGSDDDLEGRDCAVDDVAPILVARIREEGDIPSVLLRIGPSVTPT